MASKKEESVETSNTCVVCFKGVDIYSIGQCDHPVCFECSTRMRVLCRQNECPICRQEMPKVIFTKNVRPFNSMQCNNNLIDVKFKIHFETEAEAKAFEALLAHECPKCKKVFATFTPLRDHVRRTHNLNYCDLCVENLKILSRERRCYTRQELATHRRVGDVDDRSHRGHPLCEFCDTRYMDNDELYRHLRRDHLFCHFCDADGLHQYYSSYDFLREHFRNEHYLCEEGECYNEKFTAVFRTDIDLKAHKTTAHGKGLGKAGLKQARTLDIEFTLAPRPRPIPRSRQYNREEENDAAGAVGGSIQEETSSGQDKNHVFAAQINTDCIEEFPSLGGSSVPSTVTSTAASTSGRNTASSVIRRGGARLYDDDFPALGPDTTQVSLKVNSERPLAVHNQSAASSQTRSSSTNVSIQVNHPRFTTTVTSHNTYNYHFPALDTGVTVGPTATSTSVHWTSKRSSENKSLSTSHSSQHHHQPNVTTTASSGHDPPPGLEAFPALLCLSKNKSSQLDNQTLSSTNDTSCEPSVTTVNSKNKKKKSKSKNINSNVSNEQNSVNKDTNNTAKKKQNNFESKSGDDSVATNSKKKAKENLLNTNNNNEIGSSINANTVNNNNNNSNNNRKVLKSAKVENAKANQTNQKKKEDSAGRTSANKEKTSAGSSTIEKKKESRSKRSSETSRTAGGAALPMELSDEPFPALGNATTVPPGFEPKWQIKRAPPGLEKCSSASGITTAPVAPPGFNHLNGFPPLAAELDATNKANYITPPDFAKRNNVLVTKMTSALGPESLELFKQISFSFRSGNLPANEYYSSCRKIMGPNTFSQLFPELLALLPDIDKQQELWSVYKSEFGKEDVSGVSAPVKTKKGATANTSSALEVCATCYQVVSTSDLRDHLTFHALDNHFPVLDSSHNNTYNNNAWIQHK